jgi:hypothetical protein
MLGPTDPRDPFAACDAGKIDRSHPSICGIERIMPRVGDFDRFVFVVGAPRCGTTTLAHFLKCSPAACFPVVKEPHFFSQCDLRSLSLTDLRHRVESDYLRRFFRHDPARRVAIDGSVTYLYAPEQLEPVLRLWPDSRFVVSLRDPLTMLPSLHRRLLYIGDETIENFEEAWAAIPERHQGRRIPRRCADPRWLFYDEAARFSTYLERLFAVVGRDRCRVVLFDDLVADPNTEYRNLMEFAGLEAQAHVDLSPQRESRGVRLRWLQRLLKRPPHALREFLSGEQFLQRVRDFDSSRSQRLAGAVMSLRKQILHWNRCDPKPVRLSKSFQERLRNELRSEIESLGRLLDRDLCHWLRPAMSDGSAEKAARQGGGRTAFVLEPASSGQGRHSRTGRDYPAVTGRQIGINP